MGQVKVVAIGAGNRMNAYTEYAVIHPEEVCIVAVVEPNVVRRDLYAGRLGIPAENCFDSWEQLMARSKLADAVFICTPDQLHYEPTIAALEKGYDVLLEKPIARSWKECADIVERARQLNRIVGVCHILRYHPYFIKFREVVDGGELGEVISVNHVEAVGIERMVHAFVRGLWRREDETNPMILSKACHDLDLLVWLTGRKCLRASSYGSLKWFKECNAPEGSTARCADGCRVERSCPYSAIDIYYRRKRWLRHFDFAEGADVDAAIMNELKKGPYGRCVYRCDNDVVDHQVVSLLMEGDVTVNFSMDAFTKEDSRRTHVMCSNGEIFGDGKILTVRYFHSSLPDDVYDFSSYYGEGSYHGGADLNIVADFVQAVREGKGGHLRADIESSLESHRIAFEIERERLKG